MKPKTRGKERIRLVAITLICIIVIVTGILFSLQSFIKREIWGGIIGILIAVIIVTFAVIVVRRGNRDMRKGYPVQDERSKKVLEKASSRAFYVSLYILLAIGFLSNKIRFRDISQATSVAVGIMALLFLIFWIYYNKKES